MNWFKTFQSENNYPNYLQVGHYVLNKDKNKNQDCNVHLWIYDGKAVQAKPSEHQDTHNKLFGYLMKDVLYYGRYDGCQKTISVVAKPVMQQKPPPDILIRNLINKFGQENRVLFYESKGGGKVVEMSSFIEIKKQSQIEEYDLSDLEYADNISEAKNILSSLNMPF